MPTMPTNEYEKILAELKGKSADATSRAGDSALHQTTVRNLLLAAALTIALYFVPYAGFVTYPLRLLVTFIHEGSHALAALMTGGIPRMMAIQPDGSGLTMTSGGLGLVISSAGYLGATFYGAALIAALRRGVPGRTLLLVTGAIVGLMTLLLTRNLFGFVWGALLCGGLLLGGRKLSAEIAAWAAGFIGVQCVLNALFDLRTLFDLTVAGSGQNDAANMASMTWIPAPFWAGLWILTAFAMLALVLGPAFGAKLNLARPKRR
ncbi:MAG: M50 family metallopeptidase [Cytophagales bacterium]|nr:M50 family metallopeptidase [Armatimonadota bacterium]